MVQHLPAPRYRNHEIQEAVERIAQSVSRWILDKKSRSLSVVSVLEGAKPFTGDLLTCLKRQVPELEVKILEVRVKGTEGTALLQSREYNGVFFSPNEVEGRAVLIVDDLVDSGKTLAVLKAAIDRMGAAEVRTAALIRKFGADSGPADFCGFDLNLDRKRLAQQG